jgi:RND family efflux transporter MFP subunit
MKPAAAATAAIAIGLALACSRGHETPPAAPEPAPVAVRTARVGGAGDGFVEIPGTLEALRAATLASRFSAVVEEIPAEEGVAVRAGDLLVRLDGRDVRARLQSAEAGLAAARAQRDRIRTLHSKGAATRQELDAAEAQDAAAEADRDAARAQIEYVDLRAPFDGWITQKNVRSGDLAVPGQPLLTMQGTGRLRVAASVTKEQADRLAVGRSVEAVLEDGTVLAARLAVVSPAGDPASRRFLVKADLPGDARARAGSFGRLRLPRGGEAAVPIVPKAALFERGALTGVFVVEEGRARLRWISVGEDAGDAAIVRAGLAAGEEVILDPPPLADGAPVTAAPEQAP